MNRRERKRFKLKRKQLLKSYDFVPVSKHDIVMSGQIGSILGVNIISDAWDTRSLYESGYYKYAPREYSGIRRWTRT